ncbi:MAG: AraC family ligand binding domain-containing protein, partial [Spirochaetes bacterium]|nr:AraC family ligand binding domain-containing protein [Spirochaetota bacterium]
MELTSYFDQKLPPATTCARHSHPCWELVLMTGSEGWVDFNGRRESYGDGFISIHPPGEAHYCYYRSAARHVCLGLRGHELAGLRGGCRRASPALIRLAELLDGEARRQGPYSRLMMNHLASLIALTLLQEETGAAPPVGEASPAQEAKRLMDSRLGGEELSLDELSRKVFLDKEQLRYLFKKEYGIAPMRYLIQKKIDYAKVLLA